MLPNVTKLGAQFILGTLEVLSARDSGSRRRDIRAAPASLVKVTGHRRPSTTKRAGCGQGPPGSMGRPGGPAAAHRDGDGMGHVCPASAKIGQNGPGQGMPALREDENPGNPVLAACLPVHCAGRMRCPVGAGHDVRVQTNKKPNHNRLGFLCLGREH